MKTYSRPYNTRYGDITGTIFELDDILQDNFKYFNKNKRSKFKTFDSLYKSVFERFKNRINSTWHKRSKKQIINSTMRKICTTFYDNMLKDLIYRDYEFIFPDDTCRLSIGHKTWTDPECIHKFRYNIATGGLTTTERIVFSYTIFRKMNMIRYYFRLSSKYRYMLMQEVIINNHEYQNSQHYDSSK
jgi:hypothetical protein